LDANHPARDASFAPLPVPRMPAPLPVEQFEVRLGDRVLLTALARMAHEGASPGLPTCAGLLVGDALGARRQCTVVRTDPCGRKVACDTPEGAVDAAAFVLVPLGDDQGSGKVPGGAAWVGAAAGGTRSSTGSSSGARGRALVFGQPVLLQHVLSGRYLSAGEPDEARSTVLSDAPAELARENGRLALLPLSLATSGSSAGSSSSSSSSSRGGGGRLGGHPREHVLASCTFRFLPSTNHGRAQVFTGGKSVRPD
jgi:hypothetical protein